MSQHQDTRQDTSHGMKGEERCNQQLDLHQCQNSLDGRLYATGLYR